MLNGDLLRRGIECHGLEILDHYTSQDSNERLSAVQVLMLTASHLRAVREVLYLATRLYLWALGLSTYVVIPTVLFFCFVRPCVDKSLSSSHTEG